MSINPKLKSLFDPKFIPSKLRFHKSTLNQARERIQSAGLDNKPINTAVKKVVIKHKKPIIKALKTKNYKKLKLELVKTGTESFAEVRGLFKFDKKTPANLVASVGLLILVLLTSLFLTLVLAVVIGLPILAVSGSSTAAGSVVAILTVVVIAPLVEEYSKLIALKNNMASEYLLVFNTYEFTGYVIMMSNMGISKFASVLIRLLAVIMHYSTAKTIKINMEKGNEKKGLYIGIAIHALYNAFGVLTNSKLSEMLLNN